ncbi:hypothetical protein Anas_00928 [Armadillidium nasatum]|uniref:SID1 transmembrane family member 1 n=1 Tax=Armadillidium nasatum TaxID=96803 RepID=A0A5N5SJM2_9CRUS|nr:hypothetical protein Anas_00928 [Armadillidium nasatum]
MIEDVVAGTDKASFICFVFQAFVCKEKGTVLSWIYLSVSVILWGVALFFLFIENSDVETTPAISHSKNADCRLFDVFSAHDIWHVTSAFALYTSLLPKIE